MPPRRSRTSQLATASEGPSTTNAAPPTTASLDQLLNNDASTLLDLVDELRVCGLDSLMELPQVVVCGDQSSGKSSVMQNITGADFPSNEGLCTRFPTRIILRRSQQEGIRCRIIPDNQNTEAEKSRLEEFSETITSLQNLPKLVAAAAKHMKTGKQQNAKSSFSRNVLAVEIAGPNRVPLTLTDIPGWINNGSGGITQGDIDLVQGMIKGYLAQENTLILAVIAANNDPGTQTMTNICQEFDTKRQRTLGIITKPDKISKGSHTEKDWIKMAKNEDIILELGWHVLKNRKVHHTTSFEEQDSSLEDRNKSESSFLSTGAWQQIPESKKGIQSLVPRISNIVYELHKAQLPRVLGEVDAMYARTVQSLRQLGDSRSSLTEKRKVLHTISITYHHMVKDAVNGTTHGPLLTQASKNPNDQNPNFLRAVVVDLQENFTRQMIKYGNKYRIEASKDAPGTYEPGQEPTVSREYAKAKDQQIAWIRSKAVEWVKNLHRTTRGRDLPGSFDSVLIGRLFHEQSENWEQLAYAHIDRVFNACIRLVKTAIRAAAAEDALYKNIRVRLQEVMDQRLKRAYEELKKLIQDKNEPVTIYEPDYALSVQKRLDHKLRTQLEAARNWGPTSAEAWGSDSPNRDGNTISAEKALDHMITLYQSKLKAFSENVTQQVVERHLLRNLADETFSPQKVQDLDDDDIAALAAESESVAATRKKLEHEKKILEKARKAFNKVINPLKRDFEDLGGDGGQMPDSKRPAVLTLVDDD